MRGIRRPIFVVILMGVGAALMAQAQISVPLDDAVYFILEDAEARGLCAPLPAVKPYRRQFVYERLNVLLDAETGLSERERSILERERERFAPIEKTGFTFSRGFWHIENKSRSDASFDLEAGVQAELAGSGAYDVTGGKAHGGLDAIAGPFVRGDLGAHISYSFLIMVGLYYAPRADIPDVIIRPQTGDNPSGNDREKRGVMHGEPYAYFPFTYRSKWQGFVSYTESIDPGSATGWPHKVSLSFNVLTELTGSVLSDAFLFRFGRLDREWSGAVEGSSLVLNKSAQPFFGVDLIFSPFSWFAVSSLTGILEYYDEEGIKVSSSKFQNAFSILMCEINYKNYFHLDFGSNAVWLKRFELGYVFPLTDKFLYQNSVGDFDNILLFGNLKLQKPGLGMLWASLLIDEVSMNKDFFIQDRQMYAYQAGVRALIPQLPFAMLTLSYTKIEPYCYTHLALDHNPWIEGDEVEESYTNHGFGLGYYLPPNADELKLRFEMMPLPALRTHAQFQMIRHGATYGTSRVDGSSYQSEMSGGGRDTNPLYKKFFLHDGAYQWFFILKSGASMRLAKTPLTLFGEAGVVFSYFTNISGAANSGASSSYSRIDTGEYPAATSLIATLGVKLVF